MSYYGQPMPMMGYSPPMMGYSRPEESNTGLIIGIILVVIIIFVVAGVGIWYVVSESDAEQKKKDAAAASAAAATAASDAAAAQAAADAAAAKAATDASAKAAADAAAAKAAADAAAAANPLVCANTTPSAVDFYNTKGEWKGVYTMSPILSNKVSDNTCDISYRYIPVGQTKATGGDRRRFTYTWDGTKWNASAMGAYNTGVTVGMPRLYNFYQGKDMSGNDIIPPSPYTHSSVGDLLRKCNTTTGCVAANTNGWIKNRLNNALSAEASFAGATQGVYVLASNAGALGAATSTAVERFQGARNLERFVNW